MSPLTPDPALTSATAIAPDLLVKLICQHVGSITHTQLRTAGYQEQEVDAFLAQGVLVTDKAKEYRLADPDVYIDWLIQALWEIPEGIIGHLTALEYHGIAVAWLRHVDVGVVQSPAHPASARIRPFLVSYALQGYGVESVSPSLPGSVSVCMYTPAVALAQVLSDQSCDRESRADALARYLGYYGLDDALREAIERYGVAEQLQEILHIYA